MTFSRSLLLGAAFTALAWGAYTVLPMRDPGDIKSTAVSETDSATHPTNITSDIGRTRARSSAKDVSEPNVSGSRLARLEAEVASMQQQLQAQTAQLEELLATNNDVESSAVEISPEEYELEQALAKEDAEQERFARLDFIETSLRTEPVDSEWSDQASAAIKHAFNSRELAAAEVSKIDCRSTLCQVDVRHDNQETFTAFQLWFPLQVAETLPRLAMDHSEEGDDRFSTVVYLAREGYKLPAPEVGQLGGLREPM